MAQQFAINGQTLDYITEATWDETPVSAPLAGGTTFNRWRVHRWATNVMPAAEFELIRQSLGAGVTLTTTDYDDLNGDYVTYYSATLDRLSGEHAGPVYVAVSAEFEVRV